MRIDCDIFLTLPILFVQEKIIEKKRLNNPPLVKGRFFEEGGFLLSDAMYGQKRSNFVALSRAYKSHFFTIFRSDPKNTCLPVLGHPNSNISRYFAILCPQKIPMR